MENENKVITFSLVECDLIPNERGKEKNLTLCSKHTLTLKIS